MKIAAALLCLLGLAFALPASASEKAPVLIGLDGEFGHVTSTSAQAIRQGIQIAMEEINAKGGVLGGRPLKLVERDNRSVPARGIENVRELAALPDLVGVFVGKFSPVVIEVLPIVHDLKIPLLDPWAAADEVVDNGYKPNYVFRLSLRDSWAMPALVDAAQRRGLTRVGLMLPNTAWGRSNLKAFEDIAAARPAITAAAVKWYNWGEKSLLDKYVAMLDAGATAIVLVANEMEGAILVKEVAALPRDRRLPIFSHWGVTGGDFAAMTGAALKDIDYSVVQTFTFAENSSPKARQVLKAAEGLFGITSPSGIKSQVGLAHAYDLTHLLAQAVNLAGSTARSDVRDALERIPEYEGLIKTYRPPFTPTRHEALAPDQVFVGRFTPDGMVSPAR